MNDESAGADDAPVAERVEIIREQVEKLRTILGEAKGRQLLPEEKLAFTELARAFAELTDAARTLLSD